MTEFNYSSFDSRRYGYIRGRSILNNLLLKKDFGEWGVNNVQIVSGHIAVNFQMNKSICIFDATASIHQLSDTATNNIQTLLTNKQLLQSPLSPATQSLPILACSFSSPVIKFGFEKFIAPVTSSSPITPPSSKNKSTTTTTPTIIDNSPLRFFVFESDGYLHLWEWNSFEYKWRYIVKLYLPFINRELQITTPYSIEKDLSISSASVFGSSQGLTITWINNTGSGNTPTTAVNCRVLNFNNSKSNEIQSKQTHTTIKDKYIDELFPNNLVITGLELYEVKKDWDNQLKSASSPPPTILSTKHGIWFITQSFILLWSFRNKLWNITYLKSSNSNNNNINTTNNINKAKSCEIHLDIDNQDTQIESDVNGTTSTTPSGGNSINDNCILEVLAYCKNPLTQDLLVLETSGKLFSCEPSQSEKEKLNIKLIAVLDISMVNVKSNVKMLMHQNAYVVLNEKNSYFYDTKHGSFLCKSVLPTELLISNNNDNKLQSTWENGNSGIIWGCGYWSQGDGIWEIKSTLSPSNFIENIANKSNNNNNNLKIASSICKQWDMKNLESKYLLEMALNENDEETKIQICKQLLPRLENPALIITLLSSLQSFQSCKFIMDELKLFLENYDYFENLKNGSNVNGNGNSADDDTRISKIKNSFIYHTPLNQKMIPLLKEYFQLQKNATTNSISIGQSSSLIDFSNDDNNDLLNLTDDSVILDFNYEQIDILKKRKPELLLQKLENSLSLSNIDYSGFDDINNGEVISLPMANPILLHTEESLKPLSNKDHQSNSSSIDEKLSNLNLSGGISKNNSNGSLSNSSNGINGTNNSNNSNSNSNTLITFVGNNGVVYPLKFPVFEILCQLYYILKPKNLIPFICMVHNSSIASIQQQQQQQQQQLENSNGNNNNNNNNNSINGNNNNNNNNGNGNTREKDHFFRALMSLPMSLPSATQIQEDQIDARFKLLISVGHKPNALRFLLNTNKWDKAIELVRNTTYNEAEAYVLYEILLSFCIDKKDNTKLKQCWDTIPKNFSVFNLLSLLKNNNNNNSGGSNSGGGNQQPQTTNNNNNNNATAATTENNTNNINVYNPNILSIPSVNDDLTIDMFRGQLLKMLNK